VSAVRTTADRAAGVTAGVYGRRWGRSGSRWSGVVQEAALIAGVIGIALVSVVGAADAAAEGACAPVVVSAAGGAHEAAALAARGWEGDPRDGAEALYPPGCLTA
jgi:hypothetical protein